MELKRAFTICLLLGMTCAAAIEAEISVSAAEEESFVFLPLIHSSEPNIPSEEEKIEQAVAQMLNAQRVNNGLSELTLAPELAQSARGHNKDMADNHFTGHTGSDGSSPGQRILASGYVALYWGEINGWGFGGDSGAMVDWWMNSPIHKSLILSSSFEEFGVGHIRDASSDWRYYWTVNFGIRSSTNDAPMEDSWQSCTFSVTSDSGGSSLFIYSADPCR
jgi:uncharacterized protein YkwD